MSRKGAKCPPTVGGKGEENDPPLSFTEVRAKNILACSDQPENKAREQARLYLRRCCLALLLGFCIGQSEVSVLRLWFDL